MVFLILYIALHVLYVASKDNDCHIIHGFASASGNRIHVSDIRCRSGFQQLTSHACNKHFQYACKDIDECLSTPCGYNSICTNRLGGYSCHCLPGYKTTSTNGGNCTDIDECLSSPCGYNSICTNRWGGYSCHCLPGYKTTSTNGGDCTDIDECLSSPCGYNSTCTNKLGGYSCQCLPGYKTTSTNGGDCTDEDECLALTNPCGIASECRNIPGSYRCECMFQRGYKSTSFNDVNRTVQFYVGICVGVALTGIIVLVISCVVFLKRRSNENQGSVNCSQRGRDYDDFDTVPTPRTSDTHSYTEVLDGHVGIVNLCVELTERHLKNDYEHIDYANVPPESNIYTAI